MYNINMTCDTPLIFIQLAPRIDSQYYQKGIIFPTTFPRRGGNASRSKAVGWRFLERFVKRNDLRAKRVNENPGESPERFGAFRKVRVTCSNCNSVSIIFGQLMDEMLIFIGGKT